MKRRLAYLILAAALTLIRSAPAAPSETQTIQHILNTSNDYLELAREYWPKISLGDTQAMTLSHEALNNCWHYKDEIAQAESVDDLDELLSGRHPGEGKFAKGVYFKCKRLVHNYDEFPGWQDLRLRAALAGDVRSRVLMAFDFYRFRNERTRESFPFSPGGFLVEAMRSGDPMVFSVIGILGVDYGLRLDVSPITSVAWQLVSCRLRGDSGDPSSMSVFCSFMSPECVQWTNAHELLRHQAGGDEAFAKAEQEAEDIYANVQQQRFEELDLELVW